MTLIELNNFISGNKYGRCYMVFKDDTFEKKIKDIWTKTHNGYGGFYHADWDKSQDAHKEVVAFKPSGWQSNVFYIVLR